MFQKFFKIIVLTVTVSGLISCAMMSQDTKRPHVDVTWLGGPTMLIAFNGVEILTDPMFGEGHHAYKSAIISAIEDALTPFGVHIDRAPISPPDIVALIEQGRSGS